MNNFITMITSIKFVLSHGFRVYTDPLLGMLFTVVLQDGIH